MRKFLTAFLAMVFCTMVAQAQTLQVTVLDGTEHEVLYTKKTVRKTGIVLNSGTVVEFSEIQSIRTDNFEAYEAAVLRAARKHIEGIEFEFTGDATVYSLQMEKLAKKRNKAEAARGAGGILMLLGVLSGDRGLAAAGLATYGAGSIARDSNTDKVIAAQNEAIQELQAGNAEKQEEEMSLEEELRRDYGNENVDSLLALIDRQYERALALASAGETSSDANHRLAAVWMKAAIHVDQGNAPLAKKEYEQLIVLDPEVSSLQDAEEWMELLLEDLEEFREG